MTGVPFLVSRLPCHSTSVNIGLETMAAHRAQNLLVLLPNALSFGRCEMEPESEPLKVPGSFQHF
jgi:hypothetical protein